MFRNRQLPTDRDLTGLADGSLPDDRRGEVERAVAASPELQAVVAAQRRALVAVVAAAREEAPAALRTRVESMRSGERRRTLPRLTLPRFLPAGAAAVAAVIAVLVGTLGGGVSAPTVAQAAVLATRPVVDPPPPQLGHVPLLATLRASGLPFPYWADRFGFHTVGVRRDQFRGRPATTVFYRKGSERIAYTIVGGAPLLMGARNHQTSWNGTAVWTLHSHGLRVAAWLRRGHTCVLSGRNVPEPVLVDLASWRGDGKIPY